MSNDEIRMNKEEMAQIVQMFRAQSESVSEMLSNLNNNFNTLMDTFIGDAANAFSSDYEQNLVTALKRLTEALNSSSETTQTVLQTLSDAEEEARDALQGSWIFG